MFVLLEHMDSPFYPYTMLPSSNEAPSTSAKSKRNSEDPPRSVNISNLNKTSHGGVDPSDRSAASFQPICMHRSVTTTDLDIYSETGNAIPASNYRLLSQWVKH